ncbi:NAD(P)-dependent oxidoreductase, partial [Nocardioides sp.]|uniref:NAD(P)-dependent oxidoreductase n=1 Tax=Nocardioides sp. TaxID=35761 RepID=UPI002B268DBA
MDDFYAYPTGLRLTGRRVVVVGGGHVAQRRVPHLIKAGADVVVVSPAVSPAIEGLVQGGEATWLARGFVPDDLDDT